MMIQENTNDELDILKAQIAFAKECADYHRKHYNINGAFYYNRMAMYYYLKYKCRTGYETSWWIP